MKIDNYDYTVRAKQFKRTDFWKQVRRTINGEDVSETQIDLIVNQILKLTNSSSEKDNLIDIGCGNGALTTRLQKNFQSILGVDPSSYLIGIANEFFAKDTIKFGCSDLEGVIENKLFIGYQVTLMYGVSSFITDKELETFVNLFFSHSGRRFVIGNVRDISFMHKFYVDKNIPIPSNSTNTVMGKWRSIKFFEEIGQKFNLAVEIVKMPEEFYASEYYFDVVFSA